MYEGLFDTRKGLSTKDAHDIGAMTARLMFPWDQWVHRRVDRVTFSDEDAIFRKVSVDFTLPHWFHEYRKTPPKKPKRQLVPLGFLRKEALVNFSLQDEDGSSLPLLSAPQDAQVAEAVLLHLAEISIQASIPDEVRHDIRDLVREPPTAASETYLRLFTARDKALTTREALTGMPMFASTASLFRDSFLTLSMFDIRRYERRIIHYSYEEGLSESGEFIRLVQQAVGQPRVMTVGITAPSEAASYHLEVEAPEGLMITRSISYQHIGGGVTIRRKPSAGILRRAHCHFANVPPRSRAGAAIFLHPRKSSVVRAATLTALLTLAATLAISARFSHIEKGDNAAAAALLLAVTGIVGLIVMRSGENEMATTLLFPLRVVAVLPAILGVWAAIVVVINPSPTVGYSALGAICMLMTISTALLVWNWRAVRQAVKRKSSII
jgi:hypothetical protein